MNCSFCLLVGNVALPMICFARAVLVGGSLGSASRGFNVIDLDTVMITFHNARATGEWWETGSPNVSQL